MKINSQKTAFSARKPLQIERIGLRESLFHGNLVLRYYPVNLPPTDVRQETNVFQSIFQSLMRHLN